MHVGVFEGTNLTMALFVDRSGDVRKGRRRV